MLNWFYRQRRNVIGIMAGLFILSSVSNVMAESFTRKKNTIAVVHYPIYKNDGTLITGATGTGVSYLVGFDSGTTNVMTSLAQPAVNEKSLGIYTSTFTAAMMNCDFLVFIATTTSASAVPTFRTIRTTITDPHLTATTDDGGTINVTGGAIDTVTTATTATNLTNAPTNGDLTATMKTSVTTAATSSTPALSAAGNTAVGTAVWANTTGAWVSTNTTHTDIHASSLTFTVAGKVDSNIYTWNGTAVATPGTAGIPDINVLNWKNSAAAAMTGDAYAQFASTWTVARANKLDYLDIAISSRGTSTLTAANIWDLALSGYSGDKAGYYLKYAYDNFVSTWTAVRAPKLDNLDATISSRGTGTSTLTTSDNIGLNWADIDNPTTAQNLSGTNIKTDQVVASVSGAVGSVTGGVTVTTNNDKTGYALAFAQYTNISNNIFGTSLSTYVYDGSAGGYIVNASTGGAGGGATAQQVWEYGTRSLTDKAGFSLAAGAIDVATLTDACAVKIGTYTWVATTRTLTAGTNIALAKGTGVTGFNDLASADIQTAMTSQGYTPTRAGYLDWVIINSTGINHIDTNMVDKSTWTVARANKLDNLDTNVGSRGTSTLDGSGVQSAMTTQGYTGARAVFLDQIPAITTTTNNTDNYMAHSSTWTVARANKLDYLDKAISGIDDNVWDDADRQLTALDEDVTTIDLDNTTVLATASVSQADKDYIVNTTTATIISQHGSGSYQTATGFSTHSAADVATLILATPTNKLVTDSSGRVTVSPATIQAGLDANGYTSTRASWLDYLDAPISSRMATFVYTAPPSAVAIAAESNWLWLKNLIKLTR